MQIFDRITAVDGAAVSELPASTCFGAKEVVKVVVQRPQLSDEQREVLLKELRERDGLGETSLFKAPSSERAELVKAALLLRRAWLWAALHFPQEPKKESCLEGSPPGSISWA